MDRMFISGLEPEEPEDDAWWFVFRVGEVLIVENDSSPIPRASRLTALTDQILTQQFLGLLTGQTAYAVEVPAEIEPPPGLRFEGLRALYGLVSEPVFAVAGRASQMLEWERTHRFCGRCGTPTERATGERAMRCPACGLLSFPRLSPAVITLVERGDEVLLARGVNFAAGVYSTLAGFVEPGESLEEAVEREIFEEVSVRVKNVTYFGSQPWPFPHSLMIGFLAEYDSGEIKLDEREIIDAAWFTPTTLPKLPGKISIARRLIDRYLEKHGAEYLGE
ncbi:MAG: NAD(+) diphosphatase [Thermomicrobiales bacterium]